MLSPLSCCREIRTNPATVVSAQSHPSLFPTGLAIEQVHQDPDTMMKEAVFWDLDIRQFTRGAYHNRVEVVHTGRMQISRTTYNVGVMVQGAITKGHISFSFLLPCDKPIHYCGSMTEPGHCMIVQHDQVFEFISSDAVEFLTLVFSPELVKQKIIQLGGRSLAGLINKRIVYIHPEKQHKILNLLNSIVHRLQNLSMPLTPVQELFLEEMVIEQLLLAVRFDISLKLPHRLGVAGKANRIIRANLRSRLTVNDLCTAVGCSPRTLQMAFKECFGVSPREYIHILRLNEVGRELRRNPDNTFVSEAAMKYGFSHLGRFAGDYRLFFGKLPSSTKKTFI